MAVRKATTVLAAPRAQFLVHWVLTIQLEPGKTSLTASWPRLAALSVQQEPLTSLVNVRRAIIVQLAPRVRQLCHAPKEHSGQQDLLVEETQRAAEPVHLAPIVTKRAQSLQRAALQATTVQWEPSGLNRVQWERTLALST